MKAQVEKSWTHEGPRKKREREKIAMSTKELK
jgi:hypothetical protein